MTPYSYASESKELNYSSKYKQLEAPAERIPKYFTMDKVVVNFRGEGRAKFLAVDFKFMSYYPQIVETEMEHLRPILKNDIDRVLRNQNYTKLKTYIFYSILSNSTFHYTTIKER